MRFTRNPHASNGIDAEFAQIFKSPKSGYHDIVRNDYQDCIRYQDTMSGMIGTIWGRSAAPILHAMANCCLDWRHKSEVNNSNV